VVWEGSRRAQPPAPYPDLQGVRLLTTAVWAHPGQYSPALALPSPRRVLSARRGWRSRAALRATPHGPDRALGSGEGGFAGGHEIVWMGFTCARHSLLQEARVAANMRPNPSSRRSVESRLPQTVRCVTDGLARRGCGRGHALQTSRGRTPPSSSSSFCMLGGFARCLWNPASAARCRSSGSA
jgi:hypothetical protein